MWRAVATAAAWDRRPSCSLVALSPPSLLSVPPGDHSLTAQKGNLVAALQPRTSLRSRFRCVCTAIVAFQSDVQPTIRTCSFILSPGPRELPRQQSHGMRTWRECATCSCSCSRKQWFFAEGAKHNVMENNNACSCPFRPSDRSVMNHLDAFWRFTRPHTIYGTMVRVCDDPKKNRRASL